MTNSCPLREELAAAGTSEEKFAAAEQWLTSRFEESLRPPESISKVVEMLQTEPASKCNEVMAAFNGTQKHLIAQFRKYIGLNPKHFQRILRFNDVFAKMQANQFLSWSDIAYLCGYSDQSHFIREFKNFSGFSPEEFLREDFEDETDNFFPLDRSG